MEPFIKFMRNDKTFFDLAFNYPMAFVLLAVIARRARRSDSTLNIHSLKVGEAFLGDYKNYGMTRGVYRQAIYNLQNLQLVTIRTTNKGTIAKLIDKRIFDINIDENVKEQPSTQPSNNQQSNHPTTTKKNIYKNINKEWEKEKGNNFQKKLNSDTQKIFDKFKTLYGHVPTSPLEIKKAEELLETHTLEAIFKKIDEAYKLRNEEYAVKAGSPLKLYDKWNEIIVKEEELAKSVEVRGILLNDVPIRIKPYTLDTAVQNGYLIRYAKNKFKTQEGLSEDAQKKIKEGIVTTKGVNKINISNYV